MRRVLSAVAILSFFLVGPVTTWANPRIVLELSTAREVVEKVDGKEVRKIVPTDQAEPGQTLIYLIKYRNDGDETATNVVIDGPIPAGTIYLPGSASEKGELSFSIDGGQTHRKPSLLTYEITNPDGSKEKRSASPEQYTSIRWQIPQLAAGAKDEVSFQVKVK
jgi:uncharacterized repeat protein (TIGR01451 family)